MPSLDDQQTAVLAERLAARAAELGAQVRALNEEAADTDTRQPRNQVGDTGEQGEERTREAIRHTEKERDMLELRQIADAQERLRQGHYGVCIDCGVDIPVARLQAQPFSERCVPCQEVFERTHPPGLRVPLPV